ARGSFGRGSDASETLQPGVAHYFGHVGADLADDVSVLQHTLAERDLRVHQVGHVGVQRGEQAIGHLDVGLPEHLDLGGCALRIQVRLRGAARVAFGVGARWSDLPRALGRLSFALAIGVARRAAAAVAGAVALTDAMPLLVVGRALALAGAVADAVVLDHATTVAVPREPRRFALREDLPGIDGDVASGVATGARVEVRRTLRRRH